MMRVPFVNLAAQFVDLEEDLTKAFVRVGRSGQYIMGEEVSAFESELGPFCGCSEVITVANGTDSLVLALRALGIGAGDEVITAPNSFIATAGAIAAVGAAIRFADVSADYNLDPQAVKRAITAKTKAIIAVHLTGNPADIDALKCAVADHDIAIIEDAAQAINAQYGDRMVGSLGQVASFSLHPLKNLGLLGDAGFLSTNDKVLAEKLRCLRNHGLMNRDEAALWGYNSRLDALQAAFGRVKLRRLPSWTKRFRAMADHYRSRLQDIVECPSSRKQDTSVYHNFVVQLDRRREIMFELLQNGIETKIHYPIPLHLMRAAQGLGYKRGDFPVAERQAERIMSLPIYPELTDIQIEYITDQLRRAVIKLRTENG